MVCICFKREGLIFPLLQKEGEISALVFSSILPEGELSPFCQVNGHADDEDRNQDSHGHQQDYSAAGPMCEFEKET